MRRNDHTALSMRRPCWLCSSAMPVIHGRPSLAPGAPLVWLTTSASPAFGRLLFRTMRSDRHCSPSDDRRRPSGNSCTPKRSGGRLSHAWIMPIRCWLSPVPASHVAVSRSQHPSSKQPVRSLTPFPTSGGSQRLAAELEQKLDQARAGIDSIGEQPSLAELTVLRMLATDLTQREIGAELFLSTNTVKTHTRRLYTKLGVNSRESAIRQASALGLLEIDDSPG